MVTQKPSFAAFVLLRFLFVTAVLASILGGVIYIHRQSDTLLVWVFGGIAAVEFVLVFVVYRWAKRIASELERINRYLEELEADTDASESDVRFFTREFDAINRNLHRVLKKAKKREKIKRRYNAKLKLKNRQRADMLSAIAHEFRNPVAAIMGYAQTLVEEPDLPDALRKKFLAKIYANGEKIESLLARLVLWNKFESGETTLHKSRFDLRILIEEVTASLREKYKGRIIEVKGTSELLVYADRTLVEVVLKNLVENALKYSKEEVVVTLDEASICVTDKGVGIAKEDIDKVTKKFYRAKTHSWDNSMGLGLSIVKTILKLHNTSLRIDSQPNQGSVFCVDLRPLSQNDDKIV